MNQSGGAVQVVLATIVAFMALVIFLVASIGMNFAGIHINGFLNKERMNVETQVFRETQAYVQGKHQDLANYFKEYKKTEDPTEKAALKAIVGSQFADFDINTINSPTLRSFLVSMRGY